MRPSNAPTAGLLAVTVLLAGCATLTQPQGSGGWSAADREAELTRIAVRAQVSLDPTPEPVITPDGPIDLPQALALATRGNRPTTLATLRTDRAAANVADARGRLLPSVTGTGRYSWTTDPQTNSFVIPGGGGATNSITIREQDFGTVNGTALLPLDLWGELRHTLAAAQAGFRGERARAWATTLEQSLLVVRTYFAMLQAERLRSVTDESITYHRRQVADAAARVNAGRLTRNELLVVEVALADAEQLRQRQDLAVDRARWTLNDAIGLPIDARTRLVDVPGTPDLPSPEHALRTAYRQNPALLALTEERQRLAANRTALERGALPRLQAGASVDWTSADITEPQRVGAAFLGFTWDLGTDGRRAAQIAGARISLDENRIALEQELRALDTTVRATQRAATERLSAVATAATAVAQAEENLRIREQQFDAGRATTEDVLAAQALLANQRATHATARYEAHVYRAELQRLMGLSLGDALPR